MKIGETDVLGARGKSKQNVRSSGAKISQEPKGIQSSGTTSLIETDSPNSNSQKRMERELVGSITTSTEMNAGQNQTSNGVLRLLQKISLTNINLRKLMQSVGDISNVSEDHFQKMLTAVLHARGHKVIPIQEGKKGRFVNGSPDLVVCSKLGIFWALELKSSAGIHRPDQIKMMHYIGDHYLVVVPGEKTKIHYAVKGIEELLKRADL